MDAIRTSLQGMTAGLDRFDRAAQALARQGATGDLPAAMVETAQARRQVQANAAALRVTDETVGSLLDVLA